MSTYLILQNELTSHLTDIHPSELHGLLVGYICGTKADSSLSRRQALYDDWIDARASGDLVAVLESAYTAALDGLDEYEDFGFRLLVPDDEAPIRERVAAMARWCSGFLSGLGESGRQSALEQGDVAEALKDFSQIARMSDEVPEGEENEEDLTEIEEFVRISVLLIFSETGTSGSH